MRAIRAVPLDTFSPRPNLNDRRAPWVRLASYVSDKLGQPIRVEEVGVFPGVFAAMKNATRVWAMLEGLRPEAADLMPVGQLLREPNLIPVGFAYVVGEAVLP